MHAALLFHPHPSSHPYLLLAPPRSSSHYTQLYSPHPSISFSDCSALFSSIRQDLPSICFIIPRKFMSTVLQSVIIAIWLSWYLHIAENSSKDIICREQSLDIIGVSSLRVIKLEGGSACILGLRSFRSLDKAALLMWVDPTMPSEARRGGIMCLALAASLASPYGGLCVITVEVSKKS